MKRTLSILLVFFAALNSHAQTAFPTGPVRIVVPYPPGAITDTLPRMIAEKLREEWGQPVVIDNRPGAGGRIATEFVAKSAPDGHTLIVALPDTLVIAPQLYKKNSYTIRDFAPVTMMARQSFVLVVRQDLNVNKFSDLIELAKSKPGQIKMSSWGEGSVGHLALELLKQKSGVDIVHIPYKGAQAALTDVIGGQVPLLWVSIPAAAAQVKAGKLRALAVSTTKRSPAFPDVPTMQEAGVADFEVDSWYAMLVPAKTPRPIIDRLNKALNTVLAEPAIRAQLIDQGADAVGGTPEALAKVIAAEVPKWIKLAKDANIKAD